MNIKKIKKRVLFVKNKAIPAVKFAKKAVGIGIKAKGLYDSASKLKKK